MTKMIFTEEDQYGPLRVGHSYPLLFWKEPFVPKPNIPSSKHAMLGDKIVYANYYPHEHILQAPGALRNAAEMKSLQIFMELWSSGTELGYPRRLTALMRMLSLGKFILNTVKTTLNVKKWWSLKRQLQFEAVAEEVSGI